MKLNWKFILIIFLFLILILIIFKKNNRDKFKDNILNYTYDNFNKDINIKKAHLSGEVPLNVKVCEENLKLFNKIMNKFGIFYWLSEGTALGAIRDNKILPWDDDVDVSFRYTYRETFINKVLPILLENGFVVALVRDNGNFIVLLRKDEKIDIDIVQENGICSAHDTKNTNYNKNCNDLIPYLNNIKPITFLNTTFNVPGEDYLEYLYGKTWNVPMKTK